MIPSSDWLDEAACSVFELDTNLFFERQSSRVRAAVQQICRECPVRKQCLEHALTYEVRSPRPRNTVFLAASHQPKGASYGKSAATS